MTYSFKHGEFEGPLDVLLDLIEARRLSITAVSLGKITDEYVVYIKSLSEFPLGEVSNFLVVASTLMLIKSRSLLPGLELMEEEERDIEDLETRLKLLARIRELSRNIKDGWMRHPMFSREALKGYEFGFIEPKGITADSLYKSLENLIKSFPKIIELPEKTLEKVISIEEKMIELVGRLTARIKSTFHDIVGTRNKLDIIVGFLAVLELVKEGALAVRQDERFGKEEIKKALGTLGDNLLERGIRVSRNNNEYILITAPELSGAVEDYMKEELGEDLSRAPLETLAVIVYKGSLSRGKDLRPI